MPSSERKKELRAAYKSRPVTGGVYAIRNTATGRVFLYGSPDAQGQRNRFDFAVSTGTCIHAALAADWRAYGSSVFTFEVLEELEQNPDQSAQAFRADLNALVDIWREKLAAGGGDLYPGKEVP